MHGIEPSFPIDNKIIPNDIPYDIHKAHNIRNNIPKRTHNAQIVQKYDHDKKYKFISYKEGNLVMIRFPITEI